MQGYLRRGKSSRMVAQEMHSVAEAEKQRLLDALSLPFSYPQHLPHFQAHAMRAVRFAIPRVWEDQSRLCQKTNSTPAGNYYRHGAKCPWKGCKRNNGFCLTENWAAGSPNEISSNG